MDPISERICMVSDKELALQTLNLNNVPSVELVDPKTCGFPIIGRTYGHHQGKDIMIINTKDQAFDEGYDYFTKIYLIEKEYCLEIEALEVKNVKIAVTQEVMFSEMPIRTEAFGWMWKETNLDSIPLDWFSIAVRALYVTGLTNGFVKIGVLSNESIIVTDINPSTVSFLEDKIRPTQSFTMGADIEFMLSSDEELIPASTFFPVEGPVGCDESEYALAEIRPEKAESPHVLFSNIKKLITEASEKVPYKNVHFLAGSMPFSGYQCGGHIHFGMPISLSLLRALDHYLSLPVAMIEDPRTAKLRRKTKHGGLGRYRVKPYGFEYLSLSSWIIDPKLTMSILCLARLVAKHHHELKSDTLFHPLVQKAYYQGNQIFLKQLWDEIKTTLMENKSDKEKE